MKENRSLKKIAIFGGGKILVDISDRACLPFGFKHGDLIKAPYKKECFVEGVSSITGTNIEVLWYSDKNGLAYFWYHDEVSKNLMQEAGFRLIERNIPEDEIIFNNQGYCFLL